MDLPMATAAAFLCGFASLPAALLCALSPQTSRKTMTRGRGTL